MGSALGMGVMCPFSSLDASLFFSSQDLFLTFLPAGLDHPSISTKNTATVLRGFYNFTDKSKGKCLGHTELDVSSL